jgi:hypothetical protein
MPESLAYAARANCVHILPMELPHKPHGDYHSASISKATDDHDKTTRSARKVNMLPTAAVFKKEHDHAQREVESALAAIQSTGR